MLTVPNLSRQNVHLSVPELHLPAMSAPNVDLRAAIDKVNVPEITLPSLDISKTIADVTSGVHWPRAEKPRRRWPLRLAGLVVAAAGTWLLLGSDVGRAWLSRANVTVRGWIASVRPSSDEFDLEADSTSEASEISAFDAGLPSAEPEPFAVTA